MLRINCRKTKSVAALSVTSVLMAGFIHHGLGDLVAPPEIKAPAFEIFARLVDRLQDGSMHPALKRRFSVIVGQWSVVLN
jgi:hypothetical protein